MAAISLYEALEQWKNREQNVARLFSSDALQQSPYLKAKLAHFQQLRNEYRWDKSLKGDVAMKVLKGEIRLLERKLYPNLTERLTRRLATGITAYFGPERLIEKERSKILQAVQERHINEAIQPEKSATPRERFDDTAKQVLSVYNKPGINEDSTLQTKLPPATISTSTEPLSQQQSSFNQNDPFMNNANYAQLTKVLEDTGFGKGLNDQLRDQFQRNDFHFYLIHRTPGSDERVAFLHFNKNDKDEYLFSKFNLQLKHPQYPDPIRQTFYINQGEKNITLEQASNLLSGRSVYRELSNREGEKYNVWQTVDFKQTDKYGNYVLQPYGEKYGFNLENALNKRTIQEMQDPAKKQALVTSLQNGNQALVTMTINGEDKKVLIEAVPRFKSLNVYETNGVRIKTEKLVNNNSQDQGMQQSSKANQKQSTVPGDDGEGPQAQSNKRTKKNKQSIH